MHVARGVLVPCLMLGGLLFAQGPADFPTFLSQAHVALSSVSASVAAMPQTRMKVSAQDWPLTCAAQTVCNDITVMNGYADGLKAIGIMILDANLLFRAMACAPEYAPAGGDVSLACTPAYQSIFNNYVAAVSHIQANGQTFRMGWFVSPQEQADCALGGTTTEAQLEACVRPLIVAAAKHWPGIDIQILEEPTTLGLVLGGGGSQFSVSDIHTFLVNVSAAVKAASPTTKVGVSAAGIAGTQNGGTDYSYWSDWYAFTPGTTLDFLVLDLYQGTCIVTNYPSDVGNYGSMVTSARAAHPNWDIRVGQSGPPRWCQGNHSNESYALVGTGNVQMKPVWMQWIDTMAVWGSAYGLTSWAYYCSAPLFWFTADVNNDHCSAGSYFSIALAHLSSVSDAGATANREAKWWAASTQGYARVTGRAAFGGSGN